MAWVRKVRTASGATAVQIAESVDGRRRIVKHLGSASTEAELGILMEQARAVLEGEGQGELELGLPKTVRQHRLVSGREEPGLFAQARNPEPVQAVAPGQVIGTASELLFDVLAAVYDRLGFDVLDDPVFRDLVIARVVEPTSLLDVSRVLTDLGQQSASYSTLRRSLRRAAAADGSYRDQVADACFQHAVANGDVSLVLYDVTTLYFEAEKEDGLRKVGFSKERRVDPQVVVGLLVDRQGFPLEIGCFEGNKAEKLTILPIVEQFKNRHQLADMVVVADAGMLSSGNLNKLDEAGFRFIVGSRQTKAPIDLQSHFRWHGDAFVDGQLIDTLTPKRGANEDNDTSLRAEPVWDRAAHPESWRAVWAYSGKRFARDNKTLNAQEERARAVVAGEKAARRPRFVKAKGAGQVLDESSLARARRLAGLKGYVTNIPATIMGAGEVIGCYHDLWQVEASFRMSKTDLQARPMFSRTRESIEAHLSIVFTALAVGRYAQQLTGLSIRKIVRSLRPLRSATLQINGAVQTFAPEVPEELRKVVDNLRG